MRKLTLLALVVLASPSAPAHKDRIERPRSLTVSFKTGEDVTFAFDEAVIDAVTLRIEKAEFAVPPVVCAKLRDVRFETVSFLWNGSYASAAKADYFYLRFEMGTEKTRAFGELPQVQLMFRDGKFAEATVNKKTAEDTMQESAL